MLLNKSAIALCALLALAGCQPATDKAKSQPDARPSTKAPNVQVLADTLMFPEGQPRRVWIYLPPDYATSAKRYQVVYMHDGQNVFDDATSYVGEWHVDETLNSLNEQGLSVPVVVAVDHGGEERMHELSPWRNEEYGAPAGEAYMQFIVEQVKPYIDAHFRTLPDSANTTIMGSSMGGLISHYAIVRYPKVFAKAAVFSPSFWYSEDAFTFTEQHPLPDSHKLYFIVGEKEGRQMTQGMENMVSLLRAQQFPDAHIYSEIVLGQNHNEAFWASRVEPALRWLGAVHE